MKALMSRLGWLGLAGLAVLIVASDGQAWERPPVNVITKFDFRVEVNVGPEIGRPTAPWYAYFPADPRLMPSPQVSPYPPWPAPFPPAGPPSDALKGVQNNARGLNVPVGLPLTQQWSTPFAYGSSLQPVGYVPMQAPSYWYQNR